MPLFCTVTSVFPDGFLQLLHQWKPEWMPYNLLT